MLLKVNISKIYGGNVVENVAELKEQLEVLRKKINEEITMTNGIENTSEKILKLSQELDLLVLEYQKILNKD